MSSAERGHACNSAKAATTAFTNRTGLWLTYKEPRSSPFCFVIGFYNVLETE